MPFLDMENKSISDSEKLLSALKTVVKICENRKASLQGEDVVKNTEILRVFQGLIDQYEPAGFDDFCSIRISHLDDSVREEIGRLALVRSSQNQEPQKSS